MAFDDGLVEVLARNHQYLQNKKVLIVGNITSAQILSQIKDCARTYILSDDYIMARSLSANIGVKIGNSSFERADKKHLSIFFADSSDPRLLDSIEDVDVMVLLLHKVKSLNQKYLFNLQSKLSTNTQILLLGANAIGGKSADSLVKQVAKVYKVDSARKSTLFCATLNEGAKFSLSKTLKDVQVGELCLKQEHGLFSQGELDQGTKQLLDAVHLDLSKSMLAQNSSNQAKLDKIDVLAKDFAFSSLVALDDAFSPCLDLGCGSGVIALSLAKRGLQVVASDISATALVATQQNAITHNLDLKTLACDMLPSAHELDLAKISIKEGKFKIIVTNPPFHEGIQRNLAPTLNMIAKAQEALSDDGVLYLVGNTCLHYEEPLQQAFKHVIVLSQNPKFTVFKASNYSA